MIHDVALQNLPVIFCLDRAGLVGEDGATHHGAFDLAYMSNIPQMVVGAPMNEHELRNFMFTASNFLDGPISIRYPRGGGVLDKWKYEFENIPIGKGRILRNGKKVALLTIGHAGNNANNALKELLKKGIEASHYDMRFLSPIDEALLKEAFNNHKLIITVEDGSIKGGLGSAVLEFKNKYNFNCKVITLGIPNEFVHHGDIQNLHRLCGYDSMGIIKAVLDNS